MSGVGSLGQGFAPGSGRSIDFTWPARLATLPLNGTAVGALPHYGRQNAAAPSVQNTSAQSITGGGTITWGTGTGFHGRGVVVLTAGAGADGTGATQILDTMTVQPSFGSAAEQGDDSATDDYACYRCFCIASFVTVNGINGDTGIQWSAANVGNYGIRNQGASGFGFAVTTPSRLEFVRRNGIAGALTSTVVRDVSAGDLEKWHAYEVRVIGATPRANAKLIALVDGRPVVTLDWLNDALPNPQASNGIYGFVTAIGTKSGGTSIMAVERVRFMAGPTEASLL